MKTTYHGYIPSPKIRDKSLQFEYDWLDYQIATDNVADILSFMNRKTIPTGCCCIKDVGNSKVKCRYYNDTRPIVRCELLNIDSLEYGCLKHAVKVCNEPDINIIEPYVEIFE
jgi:hypothetical protein